MYDAKGQNPLSHLTCYYCKKPGHIISDCLTLKRRREQRGEAKQTGLTTLKSKPRSFIENNTIAKITEPKSDPVIESYETLIFAASYCVIRGHKTCILNYAVTAPFTCLATYEENTVQSITSVITRISVYCGSYVYYSDKNFLSGT